MFTRKVNVEQEDIVWHSPNCRTIRLKAGNVDFVPRDNIFEHLPEFVDNFLKFQQDNETIYSLIHTNYWLSSWVGMQLRQKQDSQLVHTYHSLGATNVTTHIVWDCRLDGSSCDDVLPMAVKNFSCKRTVGEATCSKLQKIPPCRNILNIST